VIVVNSEQSIELLNKSVADELVAVHQYMYFHFHLDDQGFAPLADLFKRTAIAEMGHVEALAERILFLKGDVQMAAAARVETPITRGARTSHSMRTRPAHVRSSHRPPA
jgi:bacterioferritin